MEVEIGKLSGKLTTPQLYNLVCSLETFVFQLLQPDASLQPPVPYRKCLHDKLQTQCSENDLNLNKICPNSEDIKYKMFRFSVQSIDLCLVETHNLLYLQITPIKFSTCNLHSCHSNNGITLLINNVFIKHFIVMDSNSNLNNLNTSEHKITSLKDDLKDTGSIQDKTTRLNEALNIEFGPLFVDTAELLSIVESYTISQKKFLSIHDAKTKKLWFLWSDKYSHQSSSLNTKCGCVGGCAFFGNNLNGKNFFNLNTRNLVDGKIYKQRAEDTITEKFDKSYDFMYGESLLNPGELILGLKLNSIHEESEENLNSPVNEHKFSNVSSHFKQREDFRNSPALFSNRTSSPLYLSNKLKYQSSTNSMSPTLFNKNKLSYTNIKSTQSQLDTTTSTRKLHKLNLFTDKNRSLSETGIEKSSKFERQDRLSKLKELPVDIQSNETIKNQPRKMSDSKRLRESPSIKSIRSQQSTATGNDHYFSAEELTDELSPEKIANDLFEESESKDNEKSKKKLKGSRSSSNSSFQSACSSPKEDEDSNDNESEDEDLNDDEDNQSYYDLRDQMEKPILESSLLMSTYSNYLTLYQCENWRPKTDSVNLLTSNYIPTVRQTTFDGLSSISLIKRRKRTPNKQKLNRQNQDVDGDSDEDEYEPGSVYERMHSDSVDSTKKEGFHKTHKRQDSSERVMNLGKLEKQISKTIEIRNEKVTILVKVNGNTEIKISPLCLDGMKTFIDALTPTLAKVHPLTVVNHINTLCYNNVESKNHLKKEKTLEYGQLKLKAWHSTMERERGLNKTSNTNQNLSNQTNLSNLTTIHNLNNTPNIVNNQTHIPNISSNSTSIPAPKPNFFESRRQPVQAATVITANQYEETKNTKFQLFIQISNINVYVLQASLVEQLVDSSTIEHLNDCTCVSLVALNIGRLNFDYFNNKKERRSLHTFITNNAAQPPASIFAALTQKDLVSRLFPKKIKKEQKEVEPLTIETQELLLEETVGLGTITKLHAQLNRLKNSSSLLNDAFLTIIPKDNSKVDFEIVNLVIPQSPAKPLRKSQSLNPKSGLQRQECLHEKDFNKFANDNLEDGKPDLLNSFIMFECGLENIRVNGVKKKIITDQKSVNKSETTSDFKQGENSKKDDTKAENNEKKNDDEEIKVEENPKEEVKNNQQQTDKDQVSPFKNNASSLGGQIQTIWFNFAAPPKTPNTKKIDFTKLDWHLISTATPAINAWLNCSDRILLSAKKCNLYYERRVASLLACLMTEALEISGIHVQPKTRYWTNRLTPFSKSLYEDPSCQLMSVLRRYLSRFDTLKEIEQDLDINSLPPLKILRKGIISLSRSWKNALYMPLLVEQNIKLSRGEMGSQQNQTNIPLRLLINENNANLNLNEVQLRRKSESKLRNKIESSFRPKQQPELPRPYSFNNREFNQATSNQTSKYETVLFMNQDLDDENVDERMHLLFEDPSKLVKLGSESSSQHQQSKQVDELSNESSNKPRFMPNMLPRGSLAFPLLTNPLESLGTGVNKAYDFLFSNPQANGTTLQSKKSKNLQDPQLKDELLDSSDESEFNLNLLNDTQLNNYKRSNEENLYLWTIKQKDYTNSKNLPTSFINENQDTLNTLSNKHSTLRSATSDELEQNEQQFDKSIDILPGFVFVPTGIQLGDVKVIFEPLLISLAIENLDETDSNIAFEQLGTKISLSLIVKQLKIEIVESENSCNISNKIGSKQSPSHFDNSLENEPSAFECDSLSVGLNLRKVKDFKSNAADSSITSNNNQQFKQNETEKIPIIIVGPEGGGLSEVTTIVNFNIETDRITQRVNLPLLRLIHQVASVFENVKETRLVMKSNRVNKWKQSIFLGDLKNEQLLSFSLNNNRQSNHSNIASTTSKDHITIDMENLKENNQADDDEKEKLKIMPTCWKNMYCLLNLYETTPETKTVTDRNSYLQKQQPNQTNYPQPLSQQQPIQQVNYSDLNQHTIHNYVPETRIQIEELENRKRNYTGENQPNEQQQSQPTNDEFLSNELRKSSVAIQANFNAHSHFRKSLVNVMSSDHIKTYTHALMQRELTPFVVFGVVKIKKVNLEAKLSNLKLDGELSSFHVSLTHKEKVKGASVNQKRWKESSLTGNLGYSKISILEETQFNNHQLIVQMTVGKSLTLISSQNKKGKDHNMNSALLKIGAINIDIPQHPVELHSMMTRSSKQISTTLQEFKTQRGVFRSATTTSSKQSGDSLEQQFFNANVSSSKEQSNANNIQKSSEAKQTTFENTDKSKDQFDSGIQFRNAKTANARHPLAIDKKEEKFISPIVIQFHIVLDSFEISASLLPSLKAQYNIGQIISAGITGRKAKFTIDFEEHKLSFNTKINDNQQQTGSNLPSSASVSLPGIHVTAEYMDEAKKKSSSFISNKRQSNATGTTANQSKTNQQKSQNTTNASATKTDSFADGIVLRKGSYLNALAEIGIFEHSLTTDILNHLLLVQKVFMREVNEILQKMSGFDNDNFVPSRDRDKKNKPKITTRRYLLFTLHLRMKGIQITATTPTNSAVRLETGKIDLQLSNRVQNMLSSSTKKSSSSQLDLNLKLFIKLQLDLMVALGQLFQNPMYEEATPEFQQLTYFRTRIVMRNALQNEFISTPENDGNSQEEKEAVLIVLKRPLLYIQPIALDKAVLVWLNYKNAYEYWTDQFTGN